MVSPAAAPSPAPTAPAATAAMSQGPGNDMFAGGKLPAFKHGPKDKQKGLVVALVEAVALTLGLGFPGGAAALVGIVGAVGKGNKGGAPLAHCTGGNGPLVTSAPAEDMAHRGCVSCASHQGSSRATGLT